MAAYFDLTPQEVAFIKAAAQSGVVTMSALAERLSSIYGGKNYSLPTYDAEISSGVLTLPRPGQMTIVNVDTEGSTSTDSVTSLAAMTSGTWADGDILIFKLQSTARVVTFVDGVNIDLTGATDSTCVLSGDGALLGLCYDLNSQMWNEIFRSQASINSTSDTIGFNYDTVTIDTDSVTSTKGYLKVQSQRAGEVLAAVQIQVTAAGTDATFKLYIDEGAGQFLLAEESWTGTPLITTQITNIKNAVNASGTGYTAVDNGVNLVTVSAPAGTGTTPNATWTSAVVGTGSMTFTALTDTFAGGVAGADADDNLDTIVGLQPNMILWIENIMAANTITLVSGVTFSLGSDVPIAPGEIAMLIVVDSVVKKYWCCKKPFYASIWVDKNGNNTTGIRGVFNYPFQTIGGAMAAASLNDEIIVMGTGATGYDERNLYSTLNNIQLTFNLGAQIEYTGAVDGGIIDDSTFDLTATMKFNTAAMNSDAVAYTPAIVNSGSAGTNRSIFNINDALTELSVIGGRFDGVDRCVNISNGIIEFNNSHFVNGTSAAELIKVTGGTAIFKNCTFEIGGGVILNITGGKAIFDSCRLKNTDNVATGHGIKCSGGTVVFVGVNRIVTTHAASRSLNCTAATTAKLIGEIWTTHAIGGVGVITNSITAAPLALTVQNANVE